MAKHFAKLDNSDTTISLRDNSSTLVGKKILNMVDFEDSFNETTVASFMNDGHSYEEFHTETENNPKGKPAFVGGYYIASLDKFTNLNVFPDSWKLDGTDLIFGPPNPWPIIDDSLTDSFSYTVFWEENPNRLVRKEIDSTGVLVTPEVVQVYNTTNETWENE